MFKFVITTKQKSNKRSDTMSHKVRPLDELNKQINDILFSGGSSLISNLILRATEKIIQQALEEEMNDFLGRRWYEHKPSEEFTIPN